MNSYEQFVLKSCRKTPRSVSEAFLDASWCSAITKPKETDFDGFGAFCGGMLFLGIFAYCFWRTIGL
jgi:hypothetical protein